MSRITNMTIATTQHLEWEMMPHPQFFTDLILSDFPLFRSRLNTLYGTPSNNNIKL